jgi:hypothetical protein
MPLERRAIRSRIVRRRTLMAALLCALTAAPAAQGASPVACKRVVNPYPGTRYEGVDLRRIRAVGLPCSDARRVARRAHRKALGITPPADGIRHFGWHGWHVTGDLRGSSDRYVAKSGAKRVRWRF